MNSAEQQAWEQGMLALPRWFDGQVLRPELFRAVQRAMLNHDAARDRLSGLPSWGLAALGWDASALRRGVIDVHRLNYVFDDGRLLDCPGNGVLRSLSLEEVEPGPLSVFLVVHLETEDLDGRALHSASLTLDPDLGVGLIEGERRVVELFRLAHAPPGPVYQDGYWHLDETFSAPLLRLGSSSLLGGLVAQLQDTLVRLDAELLRMLVEEFVRGEDRGMVLRTRASAQRTRQVVIDFTEGGLHRHPFHLFDAVRGLYVDLCVLAGAKVEDPVCRYQHDRPAAWLAPLINRIERLVATPARQRTTLAFERRDDRMVASGLPVALHDAREVYLVVKNVPDGLDFSQVKLASWGRLEHVTTHNVSGIPLAPADPAELRVPSRDPVHVYRLMTFDLLQQRRHAEWQAALDEDAVAFLASGMTSVSASLMWS